MTQNHSNLLSKTAIFLLTAANIALGILVAILMMGGEFLNIALDVHSQETKSTFDVFFTTYVLHPASGIVYVSMFIGLAVYQYKIKSRFYQIMANIVMLALSLIILLKIFYLY